MSYLKLWRPSSSVEWKHLCMFGRGHHEEHSCNNGDHSCEINLHLDQWVRKCGFKKNYPPTGPIRTVNNTSHSAFGSGELKKSSLFVHWGTALFHIAYQAFSLHTKKPNFLIFNQNICCWCSKEPSHMLKLMGKVRKYSRFYAQKFSFDKPYAPSVV